MVTTDAALAKAREGKSTGAYKGLKSGALGLISSTVIGVASTAPAYSLAATLVLVVLAVGLQAPVVAVLAFVPMLLISFGYKEMNNADPDCGTVFTWSVRAFSWPRARSLGPRVGWMGGWGLIAADLLVMASLSQVAGQYVFFLFGANSIGANATSGWVLLVGVGWLVVMTAICYVGIEVSANLQKVLLGIELFALTLLSIFALVKVGNGTAPAGHLSPQWAWLNPFHLGFPAFVAGLTLMLFIYWGWDTAVSVNEETRDATVTPGRAAVISTIILLLIYFLVIFSAQAFAGVGSHGLGLANPAHESDSLSILGHAIFGTSTFGNVMYRVLILMVLSSAAASTQTTILPNARTTLSMSVYKGLPEVFGRVHRRFLTPSVSTVVFGVAALAEYLIFNYASKSGYLIPDAVTALGVMIAFYYGMTGIACIVYYWKSLRDDARTLWMRGILPGVGGAIMWAILVYSLYEDWKPSSSFTMWQMGFPPHWKIGGVFIIAVGALLVGLVLMFIYGAIRPPFFRGEVLNRDTPTLVPDDIGTPVGLFGVEPFDNVPPDGHGAPVGGPPPEQGTPVAGPPPS
ncbi:MAG TPA: APC family permease [Acidimicrobiales bacterium]|nr:APC family permease [Acidimicrobiales bacterium]